MNELTERAKLEERIRAIDVLLLDLCPFNNRAGQLHAERVEVKKKLERLEQ